jgi:hypothetical protein
MRVLFNHNLPVRYTQHSLGAVCKISLIYMQSLTSQFFNDSNEVNDVYIRNIAMHTYK